MRPANEKIAQVIFNAFMYSFESRNFGRLENDNPARSAYFVSTIAKGIHQEFFKDSKLNVVSLDGADTKRQKGEWLFDFCITEECLITDKKYGGNTYINTKILFAGESEFHTSIEGFGRDFGKLICSNVNQYCYIQGLNQKTAGGRKDFILSRKEIITNQLHNFIKDDFVLAFVPTPGVGEKKSFWDENEKEVINWIEIFIYDKSSNKFIEFKPLI